MSRLFPIALLLALAGCASTGKPVVEPAPPPPPGLDVLLGQPAETAIGLLGTPRLDKREGQARQLQFAGSCVLDVWYYPKETTVPVATHADSRLPNGTAVPAGECLQSLMRAQAAAKAAAAVAAKPTPAPAKPRAQRKRG